MIDDNTLILFAYGNELDDLEQARIAGLIESDPALAQRWRALQAELDDLRLVDGSAAPELSVARWRRALDEAADADPQAGATPAGTAQRHLWLTAVAAALVIGIGLGIGLRGPAIDPVPGPAPGPAGRAPPPANRAADVPPERGVGSPAPADRARPATATVRGLNAYLQQGQADLFRLTRAGAVTDAAQRVALAREILDRTRLYEQAAVAQGTPELARLLRAFEQSLMPLVDEQTAPGEAREDAVQLSFEFRALLTGLGRAASDQATTL